MTDHPYRQLCVEFPLPIKKWPETVGDYVNELVIAAYQNNQKIDYMELSDRHYWELLREVCLPHLKAFKWGDSFDVATPVGVIKVRCGKDTKLHLTGGRCF